MQVRKQNDKKLNAFFRLSLAFAILLFLACNGWVTWVSNWLAAQK